MPNPTSPDSKIGNSARTRARLYLHEIIFTIFKLKNLILIFKLMSSHV